MFILLSTNFYSFNSYNEDKYIDIFSHPVSYEIPELGNPETGGLAMKIRVYSTLENRYKEYKVLLDTISSSFWLISEMCYCEDCLNKNKFDSHDYFGDTSIFYNKGNLEGYITSQTVHLKSVVLENQTLLLIHHVDFPHFRKSSFDGMMGLSALLSPLHDENNYNSVVQNLRKFYNQDGLISPVYIIFKLGGKAPYVKFYFLEDFDLYHVRTNKEGKKESIYWINLADYDKLVLGLNYIKMLYYKNENLVKEEYLFEDCLQLGCRAFIDTKSYYIYGPKYQMLKLENFSKYNCDDLSNLPYLEISFFDIDAETSTSDSTLELTLSPEEWMVNDSEDSKCSPGIQDHKLDSGWSFGILFMKRFLIMYNFNKSQIGFVRSRIDNEDN